MYRGALKTWFEALILGQPFFLSICVISILNCSPGRVHTRGTCATGRNAMTCISDEEILQNYAHVPARLSHMTAVRTQCHYWHVWAHPVT